MIIQALNDYYRRKTAEEDSGLAPYGFEHKELPFILVLGSDGSLVDIEDTRDKPGRVLLQHQAFLDRLATYLQDCDDAGLAALSTFLAELDLTRLESFPIWEEIRASNPNMSFRLRGESDLVCQRPAASGGRSADHATR